MTTLTNNKQKYILPIFGGLMVVAKLPEGTPDTLKAAAGLSTAIGLLAASQPGNEPFRAGTSLAAGTAIVLTCAPENLPQPVKWLAVALSAGCVFKALTPSQTKPATRRDSPNTRIPVGTREASPLPRDESLPPQYSRYGSNSQFGVPGDNTPTSPPRRQQVASLPVASVATREEPLPTPRQATFGKRREVVGDGHRGDFPAQQDGQVPSHLRCPSGPPQNSIMTVLTPPQRERREPVADGHRGDVPEVSRRPKNTQAKALQQPTKALQQPTNLTGAPNPAGRESVGDGHRGSPPSS